MMMSTALTRPASTTPPASYAIGNLLLMEACPMTLAGIHHLLSSPQFQVRQFIDVPTVSKIRLLTLQHSIDLVVMELCGRGESVLDGLRALKQLRYHQPLLPIVVSTSLINAHLFQQLQAIGVKGIYSKCDPLSSLSTCIMHALAGTTSYSPYVAALKAIEQPWYKMLTVREMDVLECLLTGKSVTATALMLHRDIRTVSTHKRNAMNKLGFQNDSEFYTWGASLSRHSAAV